ncbi:MAG: SLC13 family permease [Bacilli bacterium]|nr:SLC13 family permease [Bacilli bacterium]
MKTKNKYGIVKVLLVVLLLVVIATYFIEGRQGSISYLALGDVFLNYVQSFYYFFDTAIFIFVVGGFYGALNKVDGYKKLVKDIVEKIGDRKKLFVCIITVAFALISSLTGLNGLLLIFVPFVVSIILLLGYDKLVALSSTVVAIALGFIGGIFITFKDASNQYATTYTTFDKLVGLKKNFTNVFPTILLLVISVGLLVFYIMSHIKKVEEEEVEVDLSKKDPLFVEQKDKRGKIVKVDYSDKKAWPIALMGCILFALLVLGFMPWSSLFGIKVFTQFHKWVTKISIPKHTLFGHKFAKYSIFTGLISNSIGAFGEWNSLGNYMMAIVLIALFIFILRFVSKVSFSDLYDGFLYGVKKMIPAVMIAMLAYSVLVCVYNSGIVETVISSVTKSYGDNVVIGSLLAVVGSILHVELYYTVAGVFSPIVSGIGTKANLSVYSVMFQSLYGLVQIFGPTSLLLIFGLSYLEVPYKNWIKYIWRFILGLIIVIFVVLMIVSAM